MILTFTGLTKEGKKREKGCHFCPLVRLLGMKQLWLVDGALNLSLMARPPLHLTAFPLAIRHPASQQQRYWSVKACQ